jgi:hypothetical protein
MSIQCNKEGMSMLPSGVGGDHPTTTPKGLKGLIQGSVSNVLKTRNKNMNIANRCQHDDLLTSDLVLTYNLVLLVFEVFEVQ